MIFYEIRFLAQPQIKFALSATTDKYKNVYEKRKNFIEISVNEGATIEYNSSFGTFASPSKAMFLSMPDLSYRSRQLERGTVSMNTVAMTISDMSFIRHDCPDYNAVSDIINDPDRADAIFLPLQMPLNEDFLHVTAIFKTLINYYILHSTVGKFHCLSKWYELVGMLSASFCATVDENTSKAKFSSSYFYTTKAKKFINKHFCENISVVDISNALSISPNYLSTIFKSDTGMTISTYINMLRVQKIRELLADDDMTMERIAQTIGLRDIRYMQRLFKKHYGISMQRCRVIDKEISLYHTKPWDVETLDKDLYHDEFGNDASDINKSTSTENNVND